jgi:hypothetical protein
MFALQEIKEYWCIVSINDQKNDIRILRKSDDLKASDWIDDDNLEYSNVYWAERFQQEPGVYRLTLEPSFLEADEADEPSTEPEFDILNTITFELLFGI